MAGAHLLYYLHAYPTLPCPCPHSRSFLSLQLSSSSSSSFMAAKASTVSSWLCCPCRCLFCGLLSCIFSVLACILLVALVLYLLFRPHLIHATVTSANLANFTLTPRTWLLRYNLSVAVSLRNPNTRIAINYHAVAAEALYQGQRFAYTDLPDLSQETKETSNVTPSFVGQHPLVGGVAAAGFRKEAIDNATFSVDVKVSAKMKLKIWALRVSGPRTNMDCALRIKRRNATAPAAAPPPDFHPTNCRVWF